MLLCVFFPPDPHLSVLFLEHWGALNCVSWALCAGEGSSCPGV